MDSPVQHPTHPVWRPERQGIPTVTERLPNDSPCLHRDHVTESAPVVEEQHMPLEGAAAKGTEW